MGRIKIDIRVYDNRWNTLAHDATIIPVVKKELPTKVGLTAKRLIIKMIKRAKHEANQKKKKTNNNTPEENNEAECEGRSEEEQKE